MRNDKEIKRGGLAGKMAGFNPEPPESVWEGVASKIGRGDSRRRLLIILAAAAGLALAITVGITLLVSDQSTEYAGKGPETVPLVPADSAERQDLPDLESERKKLSGEREMVTGIQQKQETEAHVARDAGQRKTRFEEKIIIALQEMTREDKSNLSETGEEPSRLMLADEDVTEGGEIRLEKSRQAAEFQVNEDSLLRILHPATIADVHPGNDENSGSWQVGATLSPLYSYRDAASSDVTKNAAVNSSESARMTYAGGVQVSYSQSGRLTVETGLFYTRMGVNIGDYSNFRNTWYPNRMEFSADGSNQIVSVSNSMGKIVSTGTDNFVNNYSDEGSLTDYNMLQPDVMTIDDNIVEGFTQTFDYLEVPFILKYKIIDRSLVVQLNGGLSANLLVNNSVSAITGAGSMKIGEAEDIRSINYSGNAGVGFEYDLFTRLSLTFEPRFRYYLNSVNNDYLPVTRPFTFGLYTGVNYSF
ncbi:MAG: outer membrane beta-barrel protein [Bacteroidales bacterium]